MKLIVAIIRPERLNDVLEALYAKDVRGLSIQRIQGHGGELERVGNYRGTTVKMELSDKIRIEIGVSEAFVDVTVKAIMQSAKTGDVGDGKVFILPIEKAYRIRSGEEDKDAIEWIEFQWKNDERPGFKENHVPSDEGAVKVTSGRVVELRSTVTPAD